MKRRSMIRNTLLGAMGIGQPFGRLFADGVTGPGTRSGGYHKFKLGELELCIVSDGSLSLGPVQPFFAPHTDSQKVSALLKENFRSTDAVDLGLNILVIGKGAKTILVDCGIGTTAGKGSGWLTGSLAAAGIRFESITDIVFTHGHFDHTGGVLNNKNQLTFPNARYYMPKVEHDFWIAERPDFSKCALKDPVLLKATSENAKKIIQAISGKLHLLQTKDRLFDCLRLEPATGHTPGHSMVIVYSGREELIHIADLVHSDTLLFPKPEWGFAGDTDFEAAVTTRKRVLEELAQSRKKVMAYHLGWPGLGHVRKKDSGYEWVPCVFVYPG